MHVEPNPPLSNIASVGLIPRKGPWQTKSQGMLSVLFSFSFEEIQNNFLNYDKKELAEISSDIRGLRAYTIENIPEGSVGGREFHKIRTELLFVSGESSLLVECEDLAGRKASFHLNDGNGIYIPPYIMHTYTSLSKQCSLMVFVNTLYIFEDELTHDTYSESVFTSLQAKH